MSETPTSGERELELLHELRVTLLTEARNLAQRGQYDHASTMVYAYQAIAGSVAKS